MTEITFTRVVRECHSNRKKIEEGKTKGFIYDWQVYINNEHRATFRKGFGSGYDLYDTNQNKIYNHREDRFTFMTIKQADFNDVVEKRGARIPTAIEQKFDRVFEEARMDNREWDKARAEYIQKLKEEVLREALLLVVGTYNPWTDKGKVATELLTEYTQALD